MSHPTVFRFGSFGDGLVSCTWLNEKERRKFEKGKLARRAFRNKHLLEEQQKLEEQRRKKDDEEKEAEEKAEKKTRTRRQ